MLSFSGVTFVLFCFVFVFFAFIEAAALRSMVLRSSICMPPRQPHAVTEQLSASFFVFVSSIFLFLWRCCAYFPEYICTTKVLSFVMESTWYVFSFRVVFF